MSYEHRLFGGEAEGGGEQGGEGGGDGIAVFVGIEDGGLRRGELEEGLAAGAAGHTGCAVQVDDGDGSDADRGAVEGDGRGNGGLLGAAGEAVGGVFDVGSGDDGAVLPLVGLEQEGRADAEAAVGRVGVAGGLGGAPVQGSDFGLGGRHRGMRLMGAGGEGKRCGNWRPCRTGFGTHGWAARAR